MKYERKGPDPIPFKDLPDYATFEMRRYAYVKLPEVKGGHLYETGMWVDKQYNALRLGSEEGVPAALALIAGDKEVTPKTFKLVEE